MTFFPLRGFLVFFDLAQILNLLWTSFRTQLVIHHLFNDGDDNSACSVFGRTPRDIREWTKPADFEFAVYYANILFMGTVAMVFAPLAPLVVLAAAVVFWISSWVYKYQLMFVFTSKVESGGVSLIYLLLLSVTDSRLDVAALECDGQPVTRGRYFDAVAHGS